MIASRRRRALREDGSMTAVEHRSTPPELLAAFQRALVAESADDLADLHAPDALYEFPLLDRDRRPPYVGREAIRAGFAAEWSAAPVRVTGIRNVVVHETADPEVVVAEQEAQIISTATGRQLVVPFLLVLRARDGRIVHTRDYSARAPLTDDVGAVLSLELVTVPVSDVDRAKAFYAERVGFGVDLDHRPDEHHRFVRLTPPGAACSIALTAGYVDAEPGVADRRTTRRRRRAGRPCRAARSRRGRVGGPGVAVGPL